ncbi:MAG TPA: PEP-CTERM sorting domain-containing protein [Pirellulales bacterium]|jgi:hypothetical protein
MGTSIADRLAIALRASRRRIVPLIVSCVAGMATVAVAAPVPLLPVDPGTQLANSPGPGQYFGFTDVNINGNYGWQFQVLEPVQVVGLGWYDDGADGLSHDHLVTLSGVGLSATIPAGTAASLIGSYRVELNSPITLNPGLYTVYGADYIANPDIVKFAGASVPTDSRIAQLPTPVFGNYNSFPNGALAAPGAWLGPMVFVQPVPEPSTFVLAGMAVSALAYCRRRQR